MFPRLPVPRSALLVARQGRKPEKTASDDRSRRGVAITEMDTFIAKVIPGNIVLRQVFDGIVRGSLRGLEQTWFMRLGVGDREAIDGPAGSARPTCIGTKSLVGMSKHPIARSRSVGKLQLCVS